MTLLHYQEYPQFLDQLGNSKVEKVIKSSILLVVKGDISMGKEIILNYIASCTNLPKTATGQVDCTGTVYGQ